MAGEFGISADEVIALLRQMDVPVRSHLSLLTDDQISRIRARWEREKRVRAEKAQPAPAATPRRRRTGAAPEAPVPEAPVEAASPAVRRRRRSETDHALDGAEHADDALHAHEVEPKEVAIAAPPAPEVVAPAARAAEPVVPEAPAKPTRVEAPVAAPEAAPPVAAQVSSAPVEEAAPIVKPVEPPVAHVTAPAEPIAAVEPPSGAAPVAPAAALPPDRPRPRPVVPGAPRPRPVASASPNFGSARPIRVRRPRWWTGAGTASR